ncbi:MAG: hypothetical protein RLZZ204_870 [Bacteroidota bacterium]|jgi:hypothetical protein
MIKSLRKSYNESFTKERYEDFLKALDHEFPGAIEFRVAETPVFIDGDIKVSMIDCCEHIISIIKSKEFLPKTERAIPKDEKMRNEGEHPHFLAFDFGIAEHPDGTLYPALIEMQGFPTLFAYHAYYPQILEQFFTIPADFSHYFNELNTEKYIALLKKVILGNHKPEEVILLEIKPHEQKTRIDFYCTEKYLGIKSVCLTDLIEEGHKLYYLVNGKKIQIKRIYNRVIADELNNRKEELGTTIDFSKNHDVEWVTHPHWFYRISKFTLPYLHHACIPETKFLNEVDILPNDLENYVLKPLFSFAGQGVIIDVTKKDIDGVKDPENWILQKKVKYAACINTPTGPAKVEIRLMYIWEDGAEHPILVTNLARLSKGKMIGVRYNADKDWVGGSVAYFKK